MGILRRGSMSPEPLSDNFKTFISQRCEQLRGYRTSFRILFDAWEDWCSENHLDPGSKIAFSRLIEAHGFSSEGHKTIIHDGKRKQGKVILGLKLKE
jgi:hypothetical protein